MYCHSCGHGKLPAGARFCPACGEALVADAGQPEKSSESNPSRGKKSRSAARVVIRQSVGRAEGGEVTGVRAGEVHGDVSVSQQNIIELHNPSPEALEKIGFLKRMSTEMTPSANAASLSLNSGERLSSVENNVREILEHMRKADRRGAAVTDVEVQGTRLSRTELLVKQALLLKAEAGQMWLDAISSKKDRIEAAKARQPGTTFELDMNELLADFDSALPDARLREAAALLDEAAELEPTNAEVLLHRAQVAGDLGEEPERVRGLLFKVQHLLDPPRNDTERFHLAQARFLQALAGDHVHPGLLRDARDLFQSLGRNDWVEQCDLNLGGTDAAHAGNRATAAGSAALPDLSGAWQIVSSDGGRFRLQLHPDGRLEGSRPMGLLRIPNPINGQWGVDPAVNALLLQGTIGFVQPFALHLQLNGQQGGVLDFVGSDGLSYLFSPA